MQPVTPQSLHNAPAASSGPTILLQEALAIYETEKRLQYEQVKFIFEQSRTYNTVIMGLAYGGFFALWSSANSFIADKKTMAFAGGLMTVSILSFVLFTILNMYVLQKAVLKNAKLAHMFGNPKTAEEFSASVAAIANYREAMNAALRKASARVAVLWPPFFFVSLASGIFGAVTMLYLFLKHHGLGLI
jgi:hypothetical protein